MRAGHSPCSPPKPGWGRDGPLRLGVGRRRWLPPPAPPPGALPPAPPQLPRQRGGSPRLAGASEQDPPARRPTPRAGGEGRGASTASRGALLAPSAPERGARAEAGLPFAFALTSARDSLQRAEGAREGAGRLPWRSPWAGRRAGRGRRLARPAGPRQLPSAAAGQRPAGPGWATPSDCSPPAPERGVGRWRPAARREGRPVPAGPPRHGAGTASQPPRHP